MAPSPPGLHSLIDCRGRWWSAGSGLVFSIYNAPALQKEASLLNTISLLYLPQNGSREKAKPYVRFLWDFFLYNYDYVSTLCPLPSLILEMAHLGVPLLCTPSLLTVCFAKVANQAPETLCGPHFPPIRQNPSLMGQWDKRGLYCCRVAGLLGRAVEVHGQGVTVELFHSLVSRAQPKG